MSPDTLPCHSGALEGEAQSREHQEKRTGKLKSRLYEYPSALGNLPCCTSWHSLPEFSAARQSSQQRRTGSQRQHRQHTHAKGKASKRRRVRGKCVRRRVGRRGHRRAPSLLHATRSGSADQKSRMGFVIRKAVQCTLLLPAYLPTLISVFCRTLRRPVRTRPGARALASSSKVS